MSFFSSLLFVLIIGDTSILCSGSYYICFLDFLIMPSLLCRILYPYWHVLSSLCHYWSWYHAKEGRINYIANGHVICWYSDWLITCIWCWFLLTESSWDEHFLSDGMPLWFCLPWPVCSRKFIFTGYASY